MQKHGQIFKNTRFTDSFTNNTCAVILFSLSQWNVFKIKNVFLINVHSTCMWTPFIFIEFFLCTSTCKSVQINIKKGYSLVDQRETNSNIRWQMIFIQQLMCYPFLRPFLFTNLIQFQCKFLFKNDIFKMFYRH